MDGYWNHRKSPREKKYTHGRLEWSLSPGTEGGCGGLTWGLHPRKPLMLVSLVSSYSHSMLSQNLKQQGLGRHHSHGPGS